jgi:hypothetical protein
LKLPSEAPKASEGILETSSVSVQVDLESSLRWPLGSIISISSTSHYEMEIRRVPIRLKLGTNCLANTEATVSSAYTNQSRGSRRRRLPWGNAASRSEDGRASRGREQWRRRRKRSTETLSIQCGRVVYVMERSWAGSRNLRPSWAVTWHTRGLLL